MLDDYAFYILMSILKKDGYIKIPFFAKRRLANFVSELKNNGIITDKEINGPYYLEFSSNLEYPLTNITLELTNYCNLKCIHCYGKYGMPKEIIQMKFEDYLRIKSDFDKLNVKDIALTGGECTLNDDFIKISTDILNSGYNLCILTNGYNYSILKN